MVKYFYFISSSGATDHIFLIYCYVYLSSPALFFSLSPTQVDRLVGRDHLFKRSIILIKAWCYYESRTLGAHHGLSSTSALETLVLYIFHLFHRSLNGPLAVSSVCAN